MSFSAVKLRKAWLQLHKWIGLLLAVAIIPISMTGAALVWHDPIDDWLHPQRVTEASAALSPVAYAIAAKAQISPSERVASLEIPQTGAIIASAARPAQPGGGRPVRTMIWLDPATAQPLDRAASDAGIIRFMHVLHGSLFIPVWGRPIVGWIGVAMLLSSISGLWLWWPTVGGWLKGLRWKRQRNVDANLHHLFGFWIAIPLFILSGTGVWISFPKAFERFNAASDEMRDGSGDRAGPNGNRPEPTREQRMRAQPISDPTISLDQALAITADAAPHRVARISWPTDVEGQWTIAVGSDDRERQIEVKVDAATGAATVKAPSQAPETVSRLMRRIHDGDGMGLGWQIIIFLGGLLPAMLSVTGIIMWWRARGWRAAAKGRTARATMASHGA